jgi:predicted small lipoprotein YifL
MKRAAQFILAAVAMTLLVACGTNGPVALAPSANGPTISPNYSARPSITEEQADELLATAALSTGVVVANLGGSGQPGRPISVPSQPYEICRLAWKDRLVLAGSTTAWFLNPDDQAIQRIAVYESPDAATVMAEARSASSRCPSAFSDYGPLGEGMFDNHTEITLPKYPATADEFGYCDRFTVTGGKTVWYTCSALLTTATGTSSLN